MQLWTLLNIKTPEEFHKGVLQVLDDHKYNTLMGRLSLWQKMKKYFEEWAMGLLEKLAKSKFVHGVVSKSDHFPLWGKVALVVGLIAVLVIIIYFIRKYFFRNQKLSKILGMELEEGMNSVSIRNKAEEMLLKGLEKEAIHLFYIALILQLYEKGTIVLKDYDNTRDILHKIEKVPTLQDQPYAELTNIFNRTYFGGYLLEDSELQKVKQMVDNLWQEVKHGRF